MSEYFTSTPAAILFAGLGAATLSRSVVLSMRRRRFVRARPADHERPIGTLLLVRSIRAALVGGALVALGAGILSSIDWLVILALIIGAEELLETSVMAAALRDEVARRSTA